MNNIDWNALADNLYARAEELQKKQLQVPASQVAMTAAVGASAIILGSIAQAIQAAVKKDAAG